MFSLNKSRSTANLIKGFARKKSSQIEFNQKLRELELASFRDELAPQRRLMLFLAYAMAAVFTALSLWVVCFIPT